MQKSDLELYKFRPALNGLEVLEIASYLKKYNPMSELCNKFVLQEFKITQGTANPAYITQVREPSLTDKLNGVVPVKKLTEEQLRALAYDKWNGDKSTCTVEELSYAMEYRYENNLMSAEEQKEFENKKFGKYY